MERSEVHVRIEFDRDFRGDFLDHDKLAAGCSEALVKALRTPHMRNLNPEVTVADGRNIGKYPVEV
jgi:hypothetical protein